MNKAFCVLPWLNLTTHPDGSVMPCCVSTDFIKKENETRYNLGKDSLEEIYNSKDFVNLRRKMLDGIEIPGCSYCYTQEKYGMISNRLLYNDKYKNHTFNETTVETKIQFFDLRFGNLCNLSCRSCSPVCSSTLAKELDELKDQLPAKFFGSIEVNSDNWYTSELCNANIESQFTSLDLIYLTGGEPTLIEKNIEILEKLIRQKESHHITLLFNSNLTNIKYSLCSLFPKFKSVYFNASIDGYGEMQEYLRYPSRWSQIDKNFKKLLDISNVTLTPTPVIQITNLNKIVDLFEYFESYNRKFNKLVVEIKPSILQRAEYLNLIHLPKSFKQMCWNRIDDWVKTKCEFQPDNFYKKLEIIKNKCSVDGNESRIQQYKEFNTLFDVHRKQYLKDFNPELYEIL